MNIVIEISDMDADVLGDLRMGAIADAITFALTRNIRLSYDMALTGAMRWPKSLRPEVMVLTSVGVL